ncbi:protein strawberry notch [Lasius niger]|uniref:Protein strawberry notch n=1 Tax=Lasius niger TaxID=67767 RepID=A0A0J7NYD6_LASNI|nr:protein strawberry notch [Lasius niger]
MATKKYDDGVSDDTSGSDFDDEEDPDKIEVPGGGKDLATAAGIANIKDEKPTDLPASPSEKTQGALNELNQKFGNKIPGGLVTKTATPGYEMVRVGGSQGTPPGFVNTTNQLNQLNQLAAGGYGGFPPGLASLAGFNPAAFLQSSMDMNALMGSFMGMPGMNMGVNPFVQLLNQSGIHPNWPGLSGKTVSQMWMNAGDPTKLMQPNIPEEEEVDDEDMGVAETYADYMPTKLKLGRKHPDPVVETASLSSVEPTDVWYKVSITEETIRSGALSALQLESITYASQQHEHLLPDGTRAGFLIGDGAGVGKGRTIAGIIFENYLKSRKRAIWVSVSNDLKYDAERDLKDIGASKIEVHPLNKFKYAKISSAINGNVKKGVIFSTYSALIGESSQSGGKYKSRLKQLLQWCGEDFDGLIIFDECHRAKNLCPTGSSKPTKTGLTVLELQNKLPKSRVVYASATGASEPRNMAYMVRLGMWGEGTPFPEFNDFITAVEKRGVGAMEIVAMDMKLRGMYIARQLSFHGVAFKIEEVPLSKDFTKVYDHSVRLWVEAMQRFQEAAELIDAENRMKKTMWGQFWSSHQRFFKYLCIAAKVKHAVAVAREAVKCGKCVVIGLQSTGEARTLEQLERDDGELSDFVSTAKGVLQTLVEKHFPAPDRNRIQRLLGLEPPKLKLDDDDMDGAGGSAGGSKRKPIRQAAQRASKKVRAWSSEEEISEEDRNGAHSSGSEFKLSGSESEDDHHTDEESNVSSDFNPFFSDSDSDADPWDRRKKKGKKQKKPAKKRLSTQDKIQSMLVHKQSGNRNKRNGDTAISGNMSAMGGNVPNNQAPPRDAIERACSMKEELLSQIETLGERLPPNTLDQLIDELGGPENVAEMTGRKGRVVQTEDGAIQYESRSEVDVPLETLNLTEKQRYEAPLVPPPQDYHGDFFKDVADALVGVGLICNSESTPGVLTLDKDYNNMSKFLNRILGMPVDLQNRLFKYFTDTLNAIITQAKKTGRFDMGILDLGTSGENVHRVRLYRFLRKHATGKAPTELHVVHVERGMSWSEATDKCSELTGTKEGFYLSHQIRNGKQTAILAVVVDSGKKKSESKRDQLYMVYRPNTGLQLRQESLGELEKKYKKVSADEAEPHWTQQYEASVNTCSHAYWSGNCKNATLGLMDCEVGLRRRSYNVLAGSVLSVWSRVENVLAARSGHNSKMQVVRLRTDEGLKIVGTLIPKSCMEALRQALSSDAENTEELTF